MNHAHDLGARGEQIAAEYLRDLGFHLVARNWRCSLGELDIIAIDGETAVACEVKTRSSERFGTPQEAVTPKKAARLRKLIMAWVSAQDFWIPRVRIDVVAILTDTDGTYELKHLQGVA